jgi:hypothetical protein
MNAPNGMNLESTIRVSSLDGSDVVRYTASVMVEVVINNLRTVAWHLPPQASSFGLRAARGRASGRHRDLT